MRWSEILGESKAIQWKAPHYSDHEVVWVDPNLVDQSWSKDKDHYISGPDHKNAIGKRYDRFGSWLSTAREPVEMSVLSLDWKNEIYFSNGRHRFVWMKSHGAQAIPVLVPSEQAQEIKDRFGAAHQETMIDEAFNLTGNQIHWTFKDNRMWNGDFHIGKKKFGIDFSEENGEEPTCWDVEFSASHGYTRFRNSGEMGSESLKVFGVVIGGILELIEETQPHKIKFTGSKDERRDGLYAKMLNRFANQLKHLGYSWKSYEKTYTVVFIVEKLPSS